MKIDNSLINNLYNVLNRLTSKGDKNAIIKIINKQIPKGNEYIFPYDEKIALTGKAISVHNRGVNKAELFAEEYMYNVYGLDFNNGYIAEFILESNFIGELKSLKNEFMLTRALIYKNSPQELLKEIEESYELFMINQFIAFFENVKNDYLKIKV